MGKFGTPTLRRLCDAARQKLPVRTRPHTGHWARLPTCLKAATYCSSGVRECQKMHVFCNLEDTGDGLSPLCDMTFEVVDKAFDESTSTWRISLCASATPYEPVGFAVDIPVVGWKEQIDGDEDDAFHSFWGPVTLRTRGHDSDRLLALLAEYYGISSPSNKRLGWLPKPFQPRDILLGKGWTFSQSVNCLAVGIQSNPALIADHPAHMKLFFDDGVEDGHYAEVFLNIDLSQGLCGLNEKDEKYRPELVHWLSVPGIVNANPHS